MKQITYTLLIIAMLFQANGCAVDDPEFENYEGSSEFRDNVAMFADFAVRKQSIVLNYFYYTSDGFTKDILEGSISRDEFDNFFEEISMMAQYIEDYEEAIDKMERSGVLTRTTEKGLITSSRSFLNWITGSGERNKKRVLAVASNCSESERSKLYGSLRSQWKSESSNEQDFWEKLEKGDYNNQAGQMFNDFQMASDEFIIISQEKGLTTHKIMTLEGSEGVKAGSEFMVDVIGTATPLGSGFTAVSVSEKGYQLYKADSKADKLKIASALKAELLGTEDPLATIIDSEANSEAISETVEVIKTDDSNIEDNSKKGILIIEDTEPETPSDILIAQKEGSNSAETSEASIYVAIGTVSEIGYTILNAGKWLISAIDSEGNKVTKEMTVEAGSVEYIIVETTSITEEDEEKGDTGYKPVASEDWLQLCEQYEFMKPFPAISFSFTLYDYWYNGFGTYVKIRCKVSDAEPYIEYAQAQGFSESGTTSIQGSDGWFRHLTYTVDPSNKTMMILNFHGVL